MRATPGLKESLNDLSGKLRSAVPGFRTNQPVNLGRRTSWAVIEPSAHEVGFASSLRDVPPDRRYMRVVAVAGRVTARNDVVPMSPRRVVGTTLDNYQAGHPTQCPGLHAHR